MTVCGFYQGLRAGLLWTCGQKQYLFPSNSSLSAKLSWWPGGSNIGPVIHLVDLLKSHSSYTAHPMVYLHGLFCNCKLCTMWDVIALFYTCEIYYMFCSFCERAPSSVTPLDVLRWFYFALLRELVGSFPDSDIGFKERGCPSLYRL